MVLKSGCKIFAVVTASALNSSALRRSLPGALWFFRDLMAAMISVAQCQHLSPPQLLEYQAPLLVVVC